MRINLHTISGIKCNGKCQTDINAHQTYFPKGNEGLQFFVCSFWVWASQVGTTNTRMWFYRAFSLNCNYYWFAGTCSCRVSEAINSDFMSPRNIFCTRTSLPYWIANLLWHNRVKMPILMIKNNYSLYYPLVMIWPQSATKHHAAASPSPLLVGWGGGSGKKKSKTHGLR